MTMPVKKNDYDDKKLVVKTHRIIEARYRLSVQEQKLIIFLTSLIRKDDEDFYTYKLKISDLAEFLGIQSSKDIYRRMKIITEKLITRVLKIETDAELEQFSWLSYAKYIKKKGEVLLRFDPALKPYLLQIKGHLTPYAKYPLKNVIQFRSVYSYRIFELLKKNEKIGRVVYSIDELREILEIKPDEYYKYSVFKRNVILTPQKELQESAADIVFEFSEIKAGRKIDQIEFIIQPKYPQQRELEFPPEDPNSQPVDELENLPAIDQLQEFGFAKSQLKLIARLPVEQITRNIEYARERQAVKKIKNFTGFVYRAILEDYEKNRSPEDRQRSQRRAENRQRAIEREEIEKLEKHFRASLWKRLNEKISALPAGEQQRIQADFEDLITQTPVFGKKYQEKGMKDPAVRGIYFSVFGEELLTEQERDFETYMQATGKPVYKDVEGWRYQKGN